MSTLALDTVDIFTSVSADNKNKKTAADHQRDQEKARQERLQKALRENLRKRKEQMRARLKLD